MTQRIKPQTLLLNSLLACSLLSISATPDARGFREFEPLGPDTSSTLGGTYTELPAPAQDVSRKVASAAIEKLAKLWNTPALQEALSERFFDRTRLGDSLAEKIPRDAKLRIQAIRGVQTLGQEQRENPLTGQRQLVSVVSVTAQTQLEFNSPTLGFVRRPGVNEFILEISQALP